MTEASTGGWRQRATTAAGTLAVLFLLLLLPEPSPGVPAGAGRAPFVWGQDDVWAALEARFEAERREGCAAVTPRLDAGLAALDAQLDALDGSPRAPDDPLLSALEARLFELGPTVGACPARIGEYVARVERARQRVKRLSRAWDPDSRQARDRVYRILYGGRAGVEELLLAAPQGEDLSLTRGVDEPSEAPSTVVHGVRLHSGDVLVSRGGAPTSAFIARGNDYPGNFSHIALLHVSEDGTPRVIESHIESGVSVSSAEQYLGDRKLRIMVLRLRSDLPSVRAAPRLAHLAAEAALSAATERHIPYDFAMDFRDPAEQFCSEVASAAYATQGVTLWEGLTSMSAPGTTRWLAQFGVRHFETHGPSDLEYDPKLVVVAEWRDREALFADHVDNAILDAMLEGAERGDEIGHAWPRLPLARLAKAYSVVLNLFGAVGPVPEGMSATTALRVEWLRARHARIRAGVLERAERYQRERGHHAPYWALVRMAAEARDASGGAGAGDSTASR